MTTSVLVKRELILNGLTCAHCASVIEDTVKNIDGIYSGSLNFVNKKLILQIDCDYDEEEVIGQVIKLIDAIEPGLDINIVEKNKKSINANKKELILDGLNCAHCAEVINEKIGALDNVKSCNLNFINKKLSLEIEDDSEEKLQEIIDTINNIESGLKISINDLDKKTKQDKETKSKKVINVELMKIIVASMVFGIAMYEEIIGAKFMFLPIMFIIAYVIVGGDVLYKAFKNLTRGRIFDENFLMSIATIGAIGIGEISEAVGVMLFYKVGEYLQEKAVGKSRKSIAELMQIRPDTANLKIDNTIKVVNPEDVKIGQHIIIKPGEKVPLDGIVIDGKSMVDTSALTGESVLRSVKKGDTLLSGFINKNTLLTVEVTKVFAESTVSKILDLVENASSKKSKTENFISVFCRYYTPVVVSLAILIAIVPSIFVPNAQFSEWLHRGLIFLVVSCPCALVLSIPLSYFSGIGIASKKGILIKGSNYLEALRYVDTVVFDKTGTLTEGVFEVVKVYSNNIQEDDLIKYASIAEVNSNHPIAKSILDYSKIQIDINKIEEYEEIAAHGIRVKYEGKTILAGNEKLMNANNIKFDMADEIGTTVYIAIDGDFKGYIIISDKIKEDSEQAVRDIKEQGIKETVMLTGDNKEVANKVSKKLKIDRVYSELLPGEKVDKIEMMYENRSDKEKIAFVGDGINDAPVLARVDVGIAMGGLGSDAAIEAADIVIMNDEPSKIAEAIRISKKTNKIVWQNIIFALGVKVVVMVLGTMGMASMWEAVFADVGVSLIAVINAMRIMK